MYILDCLDLNRLRHWLSDMTHGGSRFCRFEGSVFPIRPRDWQFTVVVGDVSVWSWFSGGGHAARDLVLFLLLLSLPNKTMYYES